MHLAGRIGLTTLPVGRVTLARALNIKLRESYYTFRAHKPLARVLVSVLLRRL
jgi:hypothetical protein